MATTGMHEDERTDGEATPRARRVLLVDDSADIRNVLRSALEGDRFSVVEARDGVEGLERLRADPAIGLIFVDMNMPDMDGLTMLRAVRLDPSLTEIPSVLFTGEVVGSMQDAKDLGVVVVLQKPVRLEAVLNIARRFLPGST